MPKSDPEPTPSILEDLTSEMKPGDARQYFEGGFKVLLDMAQNSSESQIKLSALQGIRDYYSIIALKDYMDEGMDKMVRTQNKTLSEVRRLKDRKAWDKDEDTDTSSEE